MPTPRVVTKSFWSDEPLVINEDYITLVEGGAAIATRQCAWLPDGRTAEQQLFGRRTGDLPPPGMA